MSSSTLSSIWPCPPETLAEQVRQSVQAAIAETAHPLAQTMQTLTSAPSEPGTQAFFASINPLLTQNLSILHRYTLRNVFSLPPNINPTAVATAIKSQQAANVDTSTLDTQIANIRARIRQYDNVIARLTAAEKTADHQVTLLRAVAPESVAPQQFHNLCADIKAAEHDFLDVTNILKEHRTNVASNDPLLQAAANVVTKSTHIPTTLNEGDENILSLRPSEEHEPLNDMPSAQSILGISMGADDTHRLDDLSSLRIRLVG